MSGVPAGRGATLLALLVACGPSSRPMPEEPLPTVGGGTPVGPVSGRPRRLMLGEMCPDRADGRPAMSLLAVREVGWSSDEEEMDLLSTRVGQRAFLVLAADGGRAGVFTALGALEGEAATVIGGYAGRGVCQPAEQDKPEDADCVTAQARCGLALTWLDQDAEDAPAPEVSGACVASGRIVVDIDADGVNESFVIAEFLDDMRAPADEVSAAVNVDEVCTPAFSLPSLITGKDPRGFKGFDLLAVIDLDADGRRELVVQYRYAAARTWAVYTAQQTATRLELAAEAVPWR